jgi:hypothetical protein
MSEVLYVGCWEIGKLVHLCHKFLNHNSNNLVISKKYCLWGEIMTLVTMMRFDENSLMAMADEQTSTSIGKSNVRTKINLVYDHDKRKIIMGNTGKSYVNIAFTQSVENKLKNRGMSIDKALYEAREFFVDFRTQKLEEFMKVKFPGVNLQSLYTGKVNKEPFSREIFNMVKTVLDGTETSMKSILGGSVLFGSYDPNIGTQVHYLKYRDCELSPIGMIPGVIGSGSLVANNILRKYLSSKPKNERENLDHTEAAITMLHSYNGACESARGVGGFPTIYYLNEGEMTVVDDNCAYLAAKIAGNDLRDTKEIFKKAADPAAWIDSLLFQDNSLNPVLENMASLAKDQTKYHRWAFGLKKY